MDTEQRLEKLKRQNRNQRMALMLLTVVLCGLVTMAATGENVLGSPVYFDTVVVSKGLVVKNKAGEIVVSLGANDGGDGLVSTSTASGKELVALGTTKDGSGGLYIYNKGGDTVVQAYADDYGHGYLGAFNRNLKGRAR